MENSLVDNMKAEMQEEVYFSRWFLQLVTEVEKLSKEEEG